MTRNRRTDRVQAITFPVNSLSIATTPVSSGVAQNRGTGASFTRLTGRWVPLCDLLVDSSDSFIWDTRNAGTFTLRFVTTWSGTTPLFTITTGQVVGAGGAITYTPDADVLPFILRAGQTYYIQLYRDTGAMQWWDYNGVNVVNNYLYTSGLFYDATDYSGSLTAPCRLKARAITYKLPAGVKVL